MAQDPRTDPDSPYYEPGFDPGTETGGQPPPPSSGGGGGGNSADQQAIIDYYNRYLGRAPEAGDVDKWLSGQYGWGGTGNLGGIETGIKMSDEATKHRAATPAQSYSGNEYQNFATTGNDYSAFNTARTQNPGKSAKDAFVYLSNQAPAPPFGDKQALAQWFSTYIKPGMDSLGHKVSSVTGDSFTYSNGEGTFTVDYAQNAGAAGGLRRLQWGAQPGDAATAARYGTGSNSVTGPSGSGGYAQGGGGGGGGGSAYSSSVDFPTLDLPDASTYLSPELAAPYVPEKFVNDLGDYTPTPWEPPKPADVYQDPSYQFRFQEGLKPVTNSQALSGLTRSGATMKALQRYGQNFASDEFGRIYDRAATSYDRTEGNRANAYNTNLASRFNTFNTNENNRATAYGNNRAGAFSLYDRDVAAQQAEFAPKQRWAELQFNRDWDLYKYANDDAFRYYNANLGAATQGSNFGYNPNA